MTGARFLLSLTTDPDLSYLYRIARQKSGERCDPNIAANGFLVLLRELRTILMQDLVQLRQILPNFYFFSHPLFSSPSFLAYERLALATIASADDPADMRLRQAMPILEGKITSGFNAVMQAAREQSLRGDATDKLVGAMATMLGDIFSGVALVRLNAEWPRSATVQTPSDLASPPLVLSTSAAIPFPAAPAANPLATLQALTHSGPTGPTTTGNVSASFTMSRSITTVADLWREYINGIGGRPSVRSLYEAKGHTWAGRDSKRKHYQRHLIILKKVEELAKKHTVREVDVVERFDGILRAMRLSLSKLETLIKKDRFPFLLTF